MQHVSGEPDATFMRPGTAGVEIHPLVAPQADEPVVQKANPNSFLDTELESMLRGLGVDSVVVCGMMTSMCVDATVRAAVDLGFEAKSRTTRAPRPTSISAVAPFPRPTCTRRSSRRSAARMRGSPPRRS